MRLALAWGALVTGMMIYVVTVGVSPQQTGWYIFQGLSWLCLFYCLASGRRWTADCLSEEKREGTLGLLFLTDLKGYDVVLGKLAATSLAGFYGLLAVFPIMALPLLLGGITSGEFWRMALVQVATFLFSLAVGIFGSALSRDFRRAIAANFLLLLLLIATGPACAGLIAYFTNPYRFFPELLLPCPAYTLYLSADAPYTLHGGQFWWSVGIIHGLTWLLLLLASGLAPHSWRDQIQLHLRDHRDGAVRGQFFRKSLCFADGDDAQFVGLQEALHRRADLFDRQSIQPGPVARPIVLAQIV